MKKGEKKGAMERNGEKKVAEDLKRQAAAVEKKLTKEQRETLKLHKPKWWMNAWVWLMVRRVMIGQRSERTRTWKVSLGWGTEQLMEARKRIRVSLKRGWPVPVYRDHAVVNHVKSLSRKDLERLAIVQATHLRTYLDFYGKNLVNHIAIDGHEMTRVGCGLQRARGVKSAADLKEGGVLKSLKKIFAFAGGKKDAEV